MLMDYPVQSPNGMDYYKLDTKSYLEDQDRRHIDEYRQQLDGLKICAVNYYDSGWTEFPQEIDVLIIHDWNGGDDIPFPDGLRLVIFKHGAMSFPDEFPASVELVIFSDSLYQDPGLECPDDLKALIIENDEFKDYEPMELTLSRDLEFLRITGIPNIVFRGNMPEALAHVSILDVITTHADHDFAPSLIAIVYASDPNHLSEASNNLGIPCTYRLERLLAVYDTLEVGGRQVSDIDGYIDSCLTQARQKSARKAIL